MLERLLSTLAEGGIHTPVELAAQLDVSERLVEHMLADLARIGYLRSVSNSRCQTPPNGDHTGPCAGCPVSSACAVCEPGSQVWALTERALIYLFVQCVDEITPHQIQRPDADPATR